jgi:preprotein translocase subunit SecE
MIEFFKQVKNELAKVVWPTRSETIKYTVTVILFSLGVAFFLGAADYGLLRLFETILTGK